MARYIPEPEPFLTPEMTGGRMRSVLSEIAWRIEGTAKALAPVDRGDYRDSIHIEFSTETFGGGPRAVATVVAGSEDPGSRMMGSEPFYEGPYVEAIYGVMQKAMGAA